MEQRKTCEFVYAQFGYTNKAKQKEKKNDEIKMFRHFIGIRYRCTRIGVQIKIAIF